MKNDFKEWIEKNKNISFRYWVHKTIFTPYEQKEKFQDQACVQCEECNFGYIVDYAILPDNDVLLGFSESKDGDYISYYKLRCIDIAFSDTDNEE